MNPEVEKLDSLRAQGVLSDVEYWNARARLTDMSPDVSTEQSEAVPPSPISTAEPAIVATRRGLWLSLAGLAVLGIAAGVVVAVHPWSGSDSSGSADGTTANGSGSSSTPAPEPSVSVDPNLAACDQAQTLASGKIKRTFDSWDVDANEFNPRVARQLRAQATLMFRLEAKAEGAVASAIHDEAKGLTDISIAMETEDDFALGEAANAANSALANLRGACDF
jgi:hypothetical protein